MLSTKLKLSYSPKEETTISKLSEQLYYEDLDSLTDIEENSISFKTLYTFEHENSIEVKVFIVNTTSKNVNFDYLPLTIANENGDVVAAETINLVDVGEIPSMNVRPYSILFSKSSIIENKSISDKCKVKIGSEMVTAETSNRTTIDYIDESISLYERRIIENYIESMPPIVKDEMRVIPYKNDIDEDEKYFTILIVANGYGNGIKLSDFNLVYVDTTGLAQASKRVKSLPVIKPNCTSVFKITLNPQDILKESFNPKKCKVIIQK